MKRILITFVIASVSILILLAQTQTVPRNNNNIQGSIKSRFLHNDINQNSKWSEHKKQALNCKTCHECEYPTKTNPCLKLCPKDSIISVYHSPEEGPEVVIMDKISGNYTPTIFSHKLHAQMSEISGGCQTCHHYNTTGPVLACRECHESSRKRDDLTKPDLKAAYHRQCMQCHRQWDINNDCNSCHQDKKKADPVKLAEAKDRLKGKSHPRIAEPHRILFETSYEKGKIVTFYHDEHVKLFGYSCSRCHQDDNCMKCHNKSNSITGGDNPYDKKLKIHKSLAEHHKPCNTCHSGDNCTKCHSSDAREPFDHKIVSGWALNRFHSSLSCDRCHENEGKFSGMNSDCISCHKNLRPGKFNHKVTGISLSENHVELDCESCHKDKNYSMTSECKDCHDDKQYPKQKPGRVIKN